MTRHGTFVCAGCGEAVHRARPVEEALRESQRQWGAIPDGHRVEICDLCHEALMAAWNALTPGERALLEAQRAVHEAGS